jgi:cytochrome c
MGRIDEVRPKIAGRLTGQICQAHLVFLVAAIYSTGCQAQDADAAKQQFTTSCGVCHATEQGVPARQGPNLGTVYGRHVAALPDFKYSDALKSGDWVWNEATLDPWIENAPAAHPVTMNYRQSNPDKRRLIISYLKGLQEAK